MAKVLVTFKIMPKDAEVNLDELESSLKNLISPDKISREPIAFGLEAILLSKLIDDAEGELGNLENKIKSLDSVGEVEVVEITRTI
jgi:elongation factor 1-beta